MKIYWSIVLPLWIMAAALWVFLLLLARQRRWGDRTRLGNPSKMPPESIEREPRRLRDIPVGEESYVSTAFVVVSKRNRKTYIDWTAYLTDAPSKWDAQWKVLVKRLERGFAITVNAGQQFRTGIILWVIMPRSSKLCRRSRLSSSLKVPPDKERD
jgi:hypothetical protein